MTTLYTTFLLFVALVRPLHMLGIWVKRRERKRVMAIFSLPAMSDRRQHRRRRCE